MKLSLKKGSWVIALSSILLLTACNKETAATDKQATVSTTAAPAQEGKSYGPADFKTDGLTITEGTDYKKIANPQSVQVVGKNEVLEFFWYGCPHCNNIEPIVQEWKKTLPDSVNFVRMPAFWGEPMDKHQKIFYALNELKKNDEMDRKVFSAIHNDGLGLNKPELISEFMVKNGIDKATWDAAYNSFAVNAEVSKANALFKAYGLTGVPVFVVNGKYSVSGENSRTLQVINKLLEQEGSVKK